MHPILFRIPLPNAPLKLWWALVAVAGISALYALLSLRRGERQVATGAAIAAALLGGLAFKFKEVSYQAPALPIYSYGVMLGVSLVIGWYLTLTLAERDGLPKETMANCYVITALAAIAGSRLLYVVTNLDEFKEFGDIFALRKGGLVAYGGFLGGFVGSWAYLAMKRIRLMPWADVAVPSLASGLLVTRIGCYLFGCDFGKRLSDTSPSFLQKLGTFPHWTEGTLDGSIGSPAYARHLEMYRGTQFEAELVRTDHSFPVHPTQLYESLVGLGLLALLLWQRKNIRFRGQIFFLFTFAYGALRFLLEILRDDTERGEYGPMMSEHVFIPGALLLLSLGFVFGISLGIKNQKMRTVARVLAFVPPVVAYVILRPPSFGKSVAIQLSTSQWIGVITALLVSFFYARLWDDARRNPGLAMSLGDPEALGEPKPEKKKAKKPIDEDDDDEEEEEEEKEESEEEDDDKAVSKERAPKPA